MRTPVFAYSIASDLVAALSAPFVREANTQGHAESCERARHVCRHVDRIVVRRIKREWLCHEHAGVVNQRVDTTELLEGRFEHSLGCVGSSDVTLYGHDVRIGGRLDRPRCCNNAVVTIPESLKDTRTDPLRCSRYYGHFLLRAHDSPRSTRKLRISQTSTSPLVIGGSNSGRSRIA